MSIINFGSLNIDHVYRVDHIASQGETVASNDYSLFAGGKGANQSIAIARAGGKVIHAGKIGYEGLWMVENMKKDGVDTSHIVVSQRTSGHAIIQVDKNGQNSIVIYGGTNKEITTDEIDAVLGNTDDNDIVLVQNEVNNIPYIIEKSYELGLKVCFNPAPMGREVFEYPLDKISMFIINESEGEALTGKSDANEILLEMSQKYAHAQIVLTRGVRGAIYQFQKEQVSVEGHRMDVVDTTGAGDTFIGYLLAGIQGNISIKDALQRANKAAGISVTRKGAAASIPFANELSNYK